MLVILEIFKIAAPFPAKFLEFQDNRMVRGQCPRHSGIVRAAVGDDSAVIDVWVEIGVDIDGTAECMFG